MSNMPNPSPHNSDDCARFEATLGSWLERDTDGNTNEWMTAHRDSCPMCAALVADLEQLVVDAAALPPIAPSRDLWADIESRLEAQVIPIGRGIATAAPATAPAAHTSAAQTVTPASRTFGIRTLAIAATLLVAVSSGVTWQLTRPSRPMVDESNVAVQPSVDSLTDTARTPELMVAAADSSPGATSRNTRGSNTRLVIDDDLPDVDATYEREIRGLRQIVDERFTELDTTTVNELRRNLDIIDRAISDSKAALARDPRSALLSTQLDRALEAKLQLMRRVALL